MRWKTLLTLCCLSWCLSAHAEPRDLQISVGDWPPYLSQELRHSGVIAHIISDLFAEEGYKVSFRFLPWPRAYSATAAGKFDATGVWMHKDERDSDFLFSAPLLDEQFVFFHLKSQPFDWHSFDDLAGMNLGGGLEYSYGSAFDAFLAKGTATMERVSSDQQNFDKLLKERVVLYPQEMNVGYAALSRHFTPAERARVTHHPKPLLVNRSYLMLPKRLADSGDLLQRFNRRLQMFRDSGRYDRYFQDLQAGKYMLTEEEAAQASAR